VMHFAGDGVFKCMAKRTMSNVVQQNSTQQGNLLFVGNLISLQTKFINRILHEVHGANSVLKAIVKRTGVYQMRQAELRNASQTLEPWVINEFQYKRMPNGNETVDRVVDDFALQCQEKYY